ncbi:hypothetical protein KRP22_014559 [Phytophthora ramorum]|nr:hypothetical protein KRP22_14335 [Phytophthora ramorum]
MDLSMILSPALEEEERVLRPPHAPPREPSRKWSAEELQCAVAILQDFQQPLSEPAFDVRGRDGVESLRYYPELRFNQEHHVDVQPAFARSDDAVLRVADGRQRGKQSKRAKSQQQGSSSTVDDMSKLDLLFQADAIIKRRRPKKAPPSPTGDKPQHLRSGVWSRAEEAYAAALVSYFLQGLLNLPEGMTLRKFLAEKLCCNRRRVSMKLGTESLAGQKIPRKVGASAFVAADPPLSDKERQEVKCVLDELRAANFCSELLNGSYPDEDDEGDSHPQRRLFKLDEDNEGDSSRRFSQRKSFKPKRGKPTIIRTGFESPEEEEFVNTMFEYFMTGALDLPEGTKLVSYLCRQLGCTPKQLSMKLAPQRMGERRFPDNVGSITYMRKKVGDAPPDNSGDDDFSEELFEIESRLTELRLAHEETHKSASAVVSTPVKRERTFSTASVSSTAAASVTSTPNTSPMRAFRRSGPWSHDEEVFASALIDCFFKGVLNIAEGTTLRAFLSSRLCCNPMRISKKLASECIADIPIPKKLGSSTYVRRPESTLEEQTEAEDALQSLQHTYLQSSSKKGNSVSGSKRPRSSRGPRPVVTTVDTDSDSTELDSDASVRPRGKSLEKLQKTVKTYSPAQEARRQRFHVPHVGPELVVPTPLKEQLA